ncbi:MAG: helix-turn-helix domain-containing protein, partial [bacterium]|nr:helix-turn-helix domain-containing protein [bacterium]
MTEELTIEGKQYISSKRASELSRYAQDYIGQLARAGLIDARRIGGLWYIHFESLKEYKDKADTFVPKPPENIQKSEWNDTLISFDGRDYISAGRAAEITGYHQDYVGQLARAGKILSRQIGNRWYVDREALLQHKEEKDDLLGAVQAQSVGIQERIDTDTESSYNAKFEAQPLLSYKTDQRAPLIPDLNEWQPIKEEITPAEIIPIRVMERKNDDSRIAK